MTCKLQLGRVTPVKTVISPAGEQTTQCGRSGAAAVLPGLCRLRTIAANGVTASSDQKVSLSPPTGGVHLSTCPPISNGAIVRSKARHSPAAAAHWDNTRNTTTHRSYSILHHQIISNITVQFWLTVERALTSRAPSHWHWTITTYPPLCYLCHSKEKTMQWMRIVSTQLGCAKPSNPGV